MSVRRRWHNPAAVQAWRQWQRYSGLAVHRHACRQHKQILVASESAADTSRSAWSAPPDGALCGSIVERGHFLVGRASTQKRQLTAALQTLREIRERAMPREAHGVRRPTALLCGKGIDCRARTFLGWTFLHTKAAADCRTRNAARNSRAHNTSRSV